MGKICDRRKRQNYAANSNLSQHQEDDPIEIRKQFEYRRKNGRLIDGFETF